MPAGIGIGQLFGLVREVRGSEGALPRIAISGPGAAELATALAAGGDPAAVVMTEAAVGQAVTIRLVEGDVSSGRARDFAAAQPGAGSGGRRSARRLLAYPARACRRRRRM